MELVRSRPIPLPVERDGGWYDDFAVTQAKHPRYGTSPGVTRSQHGVIVKAAPGDQSGDLFLGAGTPQRPKFSAPNLEVETMFRRVAGDSCILAFRFNNWDRLYLDMYTDGNIYFTKAINGNYSGIGSIPNHDSSKWTRLGVRAFGTLVEVFVNGQRRLTYTDNEALNNGEVMIQGWSSSPGVATVEAQYLVVRPL